MQLAGLLLGGPAFLKYRSYVLLLMLAQEHISLLRCESAIATGCLVVGSQTGCK